jgi:hypothetical protein
MDDKHTFGRFYTTVVNEYRVFFEDREGREFHRVVRCLDASTAVSQAMTDDRHAGGERIIFTRSEVVRGR